MKGFGRPLSPDQQKATDAFLRVIKGRKDLEARYPPFENVEACRKALEEYSIPDTGARLPEQLHENPATEAGLVQTLIILQVLQLYVGGLSSLNLIASLRSEPKSVKRRCAVSLLSGMATDLGAIGNLIEAGYDVQAKSIARSFGERVDMLVATQIDLAFANEFFDNSDIADAGRFWQRSVARGKLVRRVSARLARLSPSRQSVIDEEWKERRNSMARWLSTATHPSYVSGWFAILPELGGRDLNTAFDGTTGLFGQTTGLSIATGRAVFARVLELWFLVQTRGHHLKPKLETYVSEIEEITNNAERFIGRAIGEAYLSPHWDVWTVYYALMGYKLVPADQFSSGIDSPAPPALASRPSRVPDTPAGASG